MKKKGFTLIEVLVVAVIVAILAAVAIPAYMNYVTGAANDVAENIAGSVASLAASENSRGTFTTHSTGTTNGSAAATISVGTQSIKIPSGISISFGAGSVYASNIKGTGSRNAVY